MTDKNLISVDHSAIKFGQVLTMLLLTTAFVLDSAALLAVVACVNLLGATAPRFSVSGFIYRRIIVPLGVMKVNTVPDRPEPHRFAQGVGAFMTGAAAILVWHGLSAAAWILSGVVVVLAGVSVFAGFCVGCAVYYHLSRLGLLGVLARSERT